MAMDFRIGTRVRVYRRFTESPEAGWEQGVIIAVPGERYRVKFDDDTDELVHPNDVRILK